VTEAQVGRIEPDPFLAAGFLKRANDFTADGKSSALQPESRQVLLHNAVICACDAILAIEGFEVTGSDGGHQLRIAKAAELLPGAEPTLFEELDEVRAARNQVSYAAAAVSPEEIATTVDVVERLIAVCDASISPRLPDWLADT
jgi:hypothetical protein